MRINKLLSNYGYCSRKEANEWIRNNRIHINGSLAFPGQWAEETDDILLDGERLEKKKKVYLAFHKPPGLICTREESVEENIMAFLQLPFYVFPVGRLDKESEGLILLTNDGDWAHEILSSENHHEKEYLVTVDRTLTEEFLETLASGVDIRIGRTRPCQVEKVSEDTFRIVLTQGLNRQIRRMTKAMGYEVIFLKRMRIENLTVHGLKPGQLRPLTEEELMTLQRKLQHDPAETESRL